MKNIKKFNKKNDKDSENYLTKFLRLFGFHLFIVFTIFFINFEIKNKKHLDIKANI